MSQPRVRSTTQRRFTTLNPLTCGSLVTTSTSMPSVAPCSTVVTLNPASTQVLVRVGWIVAAWSSRSLPITLSLTLAAVTITRCQAREKAGRAEDPTAVVLDTQSIRAANHVPAATTGKDAGKKVPGRKRGPPTGPRVRKPARLRRSAARADHQHPARYRRLELHLHPL